MANYTKSFNFRNGVQVDDSNFIVNSVGLVGIGTTTPNEHLDVRGNIKVVGDSRLTGYTSVTNIEVVGVMTVGTGITLDPGSGIITATKFVGDASGLTNIVAIATDGFIANVGSLTTTAKIGIGNLSPTNQLDVSGNSKFVGVTTFAGITTVTGKTLFTKQLNVSGVSTFTGAIDANGNLDVNGTISSGDITISDNNPMITFTEDDGNPDYRIIQNGGKLAIQDIQDSFAERFAINSAGRIIINRDLDVDRNLEVTGVSTFTDDIFVGTGATVGFGTTAYFRDNAKAVFGDSEDLSILHDGTRSLISDQGEGNIVVLASAVNFKNAADNNQRLAILPNGVQAYSLNVKKFETIGAGASVYNELRVASLHGGTSGLSSHFGSLRYGDESGGAPYSTRRSLDLINTDSGNINYYINFNNKPNTGDFHWHRGVNNARLMTLTGIGGSLGIGTTDPDTPLHVIGNSTFTGNVILGGDLDVSGNANMQVVGNVVGNLQGNVFANSGVSTFKRLDLDTSSYYEFGELSAAGVGIGTTMGNFKLAVNDDADKKFFITDSGNVGIKTISNNGNALFVNGAVVALDPIGIGTDEPRAAVDFADAGQATTGLAANRMYMVPPKVGAAQTAALVSLVSGAMIYNTTLNKLQVYNGTNWETITSVEVTG